MKNTLTVHELRKQGFKIHIARKRWFSAGVDFIKGPLFRLIDVNYKNLKLLGISKSNVWPMGGITEVKLVCPDGKEYSDVATTNKKDNFNKRLGLKIALGRCLKKKRLTEEPNAS